jgi:hypothetical protein
VAPIVIDKFVMYQYICPIANALLDSIPHGHTGRTITTIALVLLMVFVINVGVYTHGDQFHARTTIRESPLFRAVYVSLCICTIARHTGYGVVCFTVVTFLPLIYVRVSELLPSLTALYAGVFLVLTGVVYGIHAFADVTVDTTVGGTQTSSIAIYWILLSYGIIYHTLWSSSHRHTSDTDSKPTFSYLFVAWRHSAIPISVSRTLIAFLCIMARDTYKGSTPTDPISYHHATHFMRVLSLLVASSTFLAWTHCQHSHRNSLSSILAASVVMSLCGMLVDNAEQVLCLCIIAPLAVWADISRIRKRDRVLVKVD